VPADSTQLQRVYVIAPPGSDAADSNLTNFRFWVEDLSTDDAHLSGHHILREGSGMSTDAEAPKQGRELTGWHVLAMFVGGSASSSA
jgi:hypothetical protein